ncbi:MAG: sulfotransferase domain-containing protein [Caldilineaceae bacterium]|nr:sulfotransferase domain-containing protein [Caldilineaceae bacterium]
MSTSSRYTINRFSEKLQLARRYAPGIIGLKPSDVLIASFPKSGNTWVRFLLCNYMLITECKNTEDIIVDFHVLDKTMPALGFSNLLEPWQHDSLPRFVKTHRTNRFPLFLPRRVIYVLRDPRDVMVSYFHFQRAHTLHNYEGDFADFIRHPKYGLEANIQHFNSWKNRITHLVLYEDLKTNTDECLGNLLESVGVAPKQATIESAIELSSFNRIRSLQSATGISGQNRFTEGFRFARQGKSGQWDDIFGEHDRKYYTELCDKYEFSKYST